MDFLSSSELVDLLPLLFCSIGAFLGFLNFVGLCFPHKSWFLPIKKDKKKVSLCTSFGVVFYKYDSCRE